MSPDQVARRLRDIADEVDSVRQLAKVGQMATAALSAEERNALAELFGVITTRLRTISADLTGAQQAKAA